MPIFWLGFLLAFGRLSFGESALQRQVFDAVWSEIEANHYDPDFGGKDWHGIGAAYRERLPLIDTAEAFDALLREMLSELEESHYAIMASSQNELLPNHWGGGVAGLSVTVAEGRPVVHRPLPGSAAEQAGLTAGMAILSINGEKVEALLERARRSGAFESALNAYWVQMIENRLLGSPGDRVELVANGGLGGLPKRFPLELEKYDGRMSVPLGHMGAMPVSMESSVGEGGIAYLRFDFWVPSLMEEIRSFIRALDEGVLGLIIDLRGNPGGIGIMATGMAGMLVEEDFRLGTMRMRKGYLNYNAYAQSGAYLGPVAILIDERSLSTSEIFAASMQESSRARVFGTQSGGAALPSMIKRLPNGYFLQMAIADYETFHGSRLEGRGVVPDEAVPLSIRRLRQGEDSVIEAARKWVLQQAR